MRIFWKKCKKLSKRLCLSPRLPPAVGSSPPDLCVGTPAYYFSFVGFISSDECVLIPSKKYKITTVNVMFLILPHFYTYFSLQTLKFSLIGGAKIFLPQGAGYPSYATGFPMAIFNFKHFTAP